MAPCAAPSPMLPATTFGVEAKDDAPEVAPWWDALLIYLSYLSTLYLYIFQFLFVAKLCRSKILNFFYL